MEEKRAVWIVAAVGIFLAVVLLSARMMSVWQAKTKTVASSRIMERGGEAPNKSGGWIKEEVKEGEKSANSEDTTRVNDMTVIANNATVFAIEKGTSDREDEREEKYGMLKEDGRKDSAIDFNKLGINDSVEKDKKGGEGEKSTDESAVQSIYVGKASSEKEKSAVKQDKESGGKSKSEAKVATVKSDVPVVKKVVVEKSEKKESAKKRESAVENTSWWVQAASFTSLKYADEARNTLGSNKINADVFTYKDSLGKVFYRVRVGPYLTKSEAEYWKSRITQIDDFSKTQSFVTRG